jgi:hypothetical protein
VLERARARAAVRRTDSLRETLIWRDAVLGAGVLGLPAHDTADLRARAEAAEAALADLRATRWRRVLFRVFFGKRGAPGP